MEDEWRNDSNLKIVLDAVDPKYDLLERLGGGGYSNVYLVHHKLLNTDRVLKVMDTEYILRTISKAESSTSEEYDKIKKRFINEAKFFLRINHPNIVKTYDVDIACNRKTGLDVPYLIMEYIEGKTLKEVITDKGKLAFSEVLKISEHILSAIGHIHSKDLLHRDIKTANIMIEETTRRAVLIDFGIAKDMIASTALTDTGMSIGTIQYMSPEQFADSSSINYKSDIYSFGVVLYEMLIGEPVFKGQTVVEIMYGHLSSPVPNVRKIYPDLPAGIQEIIEKAMAKKPEDRFQTAVEFIEALKKIENRYRKKETKQIAKAKKKEAKRKIAKSDLKAVTPNAKRDVENIPQKEEKKIASEYNRKKSTDSLEKIKKVPKKQKEKQVKIDKQKMPKMATRFFVFFLRSKRAFKFLIFLNVILVILVVLATDPLHILEGESKKQIRPLKKVELQYDDFVAAAQMFIKKGEYEKARYYVNNARTIKNSAVLKELSETITSNQRERMKKEFEVLKAFLEGNANKEKKRERCLDFLNKNLDVPQNNEIESMISYVEKYVTQHENGI